MFEFYSIARYTKARPQKYFGVLIGAMIFIMNFLFAVGFINEKFFYVFIPLIILVFINELFLKNNRPFTNISYTLLGIIYIAIPLSLTNFLVFSHSGELFGMQTGGGSDDIVNFIFQPDKKTIYSNHILLGFFFLVWSFDTGAYIIGAPFGKHKLFKRISPKKTWEGLLGGILIALIVSFFISKYFNALKISDWIIIALIVGIAGTLGDLVESMFKRSVGIKNSGNILPGHGGLLDRFDSVLFALPVVYAYIRFIT